MDVVKKIESLGSDSGKCSQKIIVADCGQLWEKVALDLSVLFCGNKVNLKSKKNIFNAHRISKLLGLHNFQFIGFTNLINEANQAY